MLEEPLHEIGYLQDAEIHNIAEAVKNVRLIGDRGTIGVDVTDESMVEFFKTAETVFTSIHTDMATIRDQLNQQQEEN